MAIVENIGTKIDSSSQNLDNTVVSSETTEVEKSKPVNGSLNGDQNLNGVFNHHDRAPDTVSVPESNYKVQMGQMGNGFEGNGVQTLKMVVNNNGYGGVNGANGSESFKKDMRELEEILSKLNPMADEFVPLSVTNNLGYLAGVGATGFGYPNNFLFPNNHGNVKGQNNRRRNNGSNQGKRRVNNKVEMERREEMVRRTVYVSDIDNLVTEEQLAALFLNCGQVVDCRICGDPSSILRFAFVEFTDEEGARAALNLSGIMLGFYPLSVLPSKTAIAPVNPTYLPRVLCFFLLKNAYYILREMINEAKLIMYLFKRCYISQSEDEREMCSRTIYCTNIDKKLTQADVKQFFESICGEVQRLRLLGDYQHSTRIAFVEFTVAESAIAALNCSGVILGSIPIRVSPSKTPVRSRIPRAPML